jgi:hypothetical protein
MKPQTKMRIGLAALSLGDAAGRLADRIEANRNSGLQATTGVSHQTFPEPREDYHRVSGDYDEEQEPAGYFGGYKGRTAYDQHMQDTSAEKSRQEHMEHTYRHWVKQRDEQEPEGGIY